MRVSVSNLEIYASRPRDRDALFNSEIWNRHRLYLALISHLKPDRSEPAEVQFAFMSEDGRMVCKESDWLVLCDGPLGIISGAGYVVLTPEQYADLVGECPE